LRIQTHTRIDLLLQFFYSLSTLLTFFTLVCSHRSFIRHSFSRACARSTSNRGIHQLASIPTPTNSRGTKITRLPSKQASILALSCISSHRIRLLSSPPGTNHSHLPLTQIRCNGSVHISDHAHFRSFNQSFLSNPPSVPIHRAAELPPID